MQQLVPNPFYPTVQAKSGPNSLKPTAQNNSNKLSS